MKILDFCIYSYISINFLINFPEFIDMQHDIKYAKQKKRLLFISNIFKIEYLENRAFTIIT